MSAERDSSNQANVALKAELERYRGVTGNTVEALEREKAVKAQLQNQNKAQVYVMYLDSLHLAVHTSSSWRVGTKYRSMLCPEPSSMSCLKL